MRILTASLLLCTQIAAADPPPPPHLDPFQQAIQAYAECIHSTDAKNVSEFKSSCSQQANAVKALVPENAQGRAEKILTEVVRKLR